MNMKNLRLWSTTIKIERVIISKNISNKFKNSVLALATSALVIVTRKSLFQNI